MNFNDDMDFMFSIRKDMIRHKGEDSCFCESNENSAVLCVCDGCGGLGARRYREYFGHTGAYIASRLVSNAVSDWYRSDCEKRKESLESCIQSAYENTVRLIDRENTLKGTMVRSFPTTLAAGYLQKKEDGLSADLFWAGDSRVYLLDEEGLAQLTEDDNDSEDAFTNTYDDGVLTNVISSDGRYEIHAKRIYVRKPAMIFAATDGCFGYIPSPMEFEYLLLNDMQTSDTPEEFREKLVSDFDNVTGDDFSMCCAGFGFGSFTQMKEKLKKRYAYLGQEYIKKTASDDFEIRKALWERYRPAYERYSGE